MTADRPDKRAFGVSVLRRLILLLVLLVVGAVAHAQTDVDDGAAAAPVLKEGRGENEMVLIHGLGSSTEVWDTIAPYLQGTFKVRTFELAGHGATQPVDDASLAREVERLETFLKEIDFPYPVLVGHGLGGMIALQYTLDHPGDVHRLIVMDTAPLQLASTEEMTAVKRQLAESYDRFVAERFLHMSLKREVSDQIVDTALRTHAPTFTALLLDSFDYDVTEQLRTLTVPMLVIGSELMFPAPTGSEHQLEHYGFANARWLSFKRIPGVGHFMMLERPVYTASILLAFGATGDAHFQR